MPEEKANVVDSTEAMAEVDAKAATEANPSAEDSSPKTFTVPEVDAVVKKRIDKQNAKHKAETDGLENRISELERMLDEKNNEVERLKAETHRAEWAKEVHAKHQAIPMDVLTCDFVSFESAEEMEAFAAFLTEHMTASVFKPMARDTGDPKSPKDDPNISFVQNLFDRKE